jgi:uncharacterized iron-regulated membrane protein
MRLPFLVRAAWRGLAALDPNQGRRRQWFSGERMFTSIAVGLGVTTLCATGLLFVVQMCEDFRDV